MKGSDPSPVDVGGGHGIDDFVGNFREVMIRTFNPIRLKL